MKRSIAIIGTRGYPSYYGGFETAVRKLAPYFVDAGWDVTVYGRRLSTVPEDPTRDSRVQSVELYGVENKSLSTLSYGLSAVLHASISKPDAALIMNVANGYWLPLLKLRGIPTLMNVDGIEWERAKWGRMAKMVFKFGAHFTARFADELVADSKEIQRRWMVDFGRDSNYIAYGGDVHEALPLEPGLEHRGYILMVARFVPENTVSEFFDAVESLASKHRIVLVGSSGYGGELDARAHQLAEKFESVWWLGHIGDDRRLNSLWQHAGVYFHGHSVGGTNPAAVQAMASGAPTVARDTPYNREVLDVAAKYVEPRSAEIVRTISGLMMDNAEQEQMASAAVSRARSAFNWMDVCAKYECQLRNLGHSSQTSP